MAMSLAEIAALSQLLDQALALPAERRQAWLDGLPPEHQPQAERLRGMLEAAARGGDDMRPWPAAPGLGGRG